MITFLYRRVKPDITVSPYSFHLTTGAHLALLQGQRSCDGQEETRTRTPGCLSGGGQGPAPPTGYSEALFYLQIP